MTSQSDGYFETARREYTDPVIRSASVHSTKFHRLDSDATEPEPACVVRYETQGYVIKERGFAERAREPCQHPACFGMADDD